MPSIRRLSVLASALLLICPALGAQQITGRVVDQRSGQPLAAVQVFIAGSGVGALSQQNGRYLLLNVPVGTHTLSAERIGYRAVTAQVTVTAGETVVRDFTLSEEALGLDEIIVTGTPGGTQRRAIGNAVTAVQAADVTRSMAVNTVTDLLGGRSPGVQFTKAAGQVGAGSPMEVRGVGSFNLSSNPLIYVDGVRINNNSQSGPMLGDFRESNPLDDINPQDIESIEIIKGPAAATLYGTEASAGVIQIITKRGAEGTPQFDVSVVMGTNYMRDPAARVGPRWGCKGNFNPPCDPATGLFMYNPYDEANWLIEQGKYEYQQPRLYQNGMSQRYNVEIRGGTPTIRYFLSTNYDDEEGIVWYNWDKTARLRGNIGVVFSEAFTLDISTGFVNGETRFMQQVDGDGGEWEDMIWGNGYCVERINPGACPRLYHFQEHLPSDVAKIDVRRDYSRFTASATLSMTPVSWLSSRAIIGLDKGWEENTSLFPKEVVLSSVYPETALGAITLERPTDTNLSLDASATARFTLNESIGTATSVGAQYYEKTYSLFGNAGSGFASPLSTTINQTPPATNTIIFNYIENKSLGFYVQEELSWNDRVFLTAAVRFDDNSAFGAEFEPVKYPKFAATWVVSEESFWTVDLINSLRLRGAWGKAGRQPDAFAGTNQYGVVPGPGGGAQLRPSAPGNPKVGPETSSELELGFDVALLDDRVAGEFTWYYEQNKDALLSVGLAPTIGFNGNTQRNLGQIDNWGWEATLNSRIYENDALSFGLDLTASHVDNEIKSLGDFPGANAGTSNSAIKIGFPYPTYSVSRVLLDAKYDPAGSQRDQRGQRISAMCDEGTPTGDGTQYAWVPTGTAIPCQNVSPLARFLQGRSFFTYRFSITPTVSLLNNTLQLHVMADGAYGKWNNTSTSYGNDYGTRCVCSVMRDAEGAYGAWWDSPHSNTSNYRADFWKLREIGLRYELPEMLVGRIGADRASLSLSGRELAIIWQKQPDVKRPITNETMGLSVGDPEMARPLGGQSNFRTMPPAHHPERDPARQLLTRTRPT